MIKLLVLAAIAALTYAELPDGAAEGAEIEVSAELADQLVAEGVARPAEAAPAPVTSGRKSVKARVLVDGQYGKVNDVVTVTAAAARASSELDADPAAVAYAESLAIGH
ncbi:hypothetical protein [Polaromonas jejuensis]|uniref:Uncharacterized protein n=1 Tax=Polaromonas jejuensis TaxID=457502 RepID=A0ABW0QK54_9BURK|nr:hypothetical protein [Polaromonas jejuensis]